MVKTTKERQASFRKRQKARNLRALVLWIPVKLDSEYITEIKEYVQEVLKDFLTENKE